MITMPGLMGQSTTCNSQLNHNYILFGKVYILAYSPFQGVRDSRYYSVCAHIVTVRPPTYFFENNRVTGLYSCGRSVELTILPLSCADCLEILTVSTT
jgi:hypothetical protein